MLRRVAAYLVILFSISGWAKPKPEHYPVLMVHGYFLPGYETWLVLKNRLIQAGWPEDFVMNPSFKNVVGCNPAHAQEIAKWVEELKERTGYDRIDIVAHSMGALDVRYYIKYLCGYRNVRKVVMIAGANHGTIVACADQISCGAKQMCRTMGDWQQNEFLRRLNDCDETPGDVLYTSIWSPYDEIIVPPESSILQGAENIQITSKPVGHGGILAVKETGDLVIYALEYGGKNYDGPSWECLAHCEGVQEEEEVLEPGEDMTEEVAEGEVVETPLDVVEVHQEDKVPSESLEELCLEGMEEELSGKDVRQAPETVKDASEELHKDLLETKRPSPEVPRTPSSGCSAYPFGLIDGVVPLFVLLGMLVFLRFRTEG